MIKVSYRCHPFAGVVKSTVPVGTTVEQVLSGLKIDSTVIATIVAVDGEWLLRNRWGETANDNMDICQLPADSTRGALMTALSIAMLATPAGWSWAAKAALQVGGTYLISKLFPLEEDNYRSPTYSTGYSGGRNRYLEGAVKAEVFGTTRVVPNYALPPWRERGYMNEVFFVSQGKNVGLKDPKMGDSSLNSSEAKWWKSPNDVGFPKSVDLDGSYDAVGSLGMLPMVQLNQSDLLDVFDGGWTKWYSVGPSNVNVGMIGIDMRVMAGAKCMFKIKPEGFIDDKGNLVRYTGRTEAKWVDMMFDSSEHGSYPFEVNYIIRLDDSKAPRKGYKINTAKPDIVSIYGSEYKNGGVWKIKFKSINDVKGDDGVIRYIKWLKSKTPYTVKGSQLVYVRTKINPQTSANSGKFSIIAERRLPTPRLNADKSLYRDSSGNLDWQEGTPGDIADAVSYCLKKIESEKYIDFDKLYSLAQTWRKNGCEVNGVFDTKTNVWDAVLKILSCGRAIPLRLWNTITFVRDEKQLIPQTMFTIDNISNFTMEYDMVTGETPTHGYVTYRDKDKDYKSSTELVIGPSGKTDGLALREDYRFITNKSHAISEMDYKLKELYYRRKKVAFTTHSLPVPLAYGTKHLLQYPLVSAEVGRGRVKSWDGVMGRMVLSDQIAFKSNESYYIRVSQSNGQLSPEISIVPYVLSSSSLSIDITDNEIELRGFSISSLKIISESELLGNSSNYIIYNQASDISEIIIKEVRPQGGEKVEIKAVIDDVRVYD